MQRKRNAVEGGTKDTRRRGAADTTHQVAVITTGAAVRVSDDAAQSRSAESTTPSQRMTDVSTTQDLPRGGKRTIEDGWRYEDEQAMTGGKKAARREDSQRDERGAVRRGGDAGNMSPCIHARSNADGDGEHGAAARRDDDATAHGGAMTSKSALLERDNNKYKNLEKNHYDNTEIQIRDDDEIHNLKFAADNETARVQERMARDEEDDQRGNKYEASTVREKREREGDDERDAMVSRGRRVKERDKM
jgi:hypothetical protein